MQSNIDHNKIINDVAKKILKPAGLIRKGQSRTWLDDNGWFTTVFEYQPSGFSKGTHLNIGINFHWYRQEHFSFDYGYRENEFVQFTNPELFTEKVTAMTERGLQKVIEYRNFKLLEHAKDKIIGAKFHCDDLWGDYHRSLICLLTKDITKARVYLAKLLDIEVNSPFILEFKQNVQALVNILDDQEQLSSYLYKLITETRALKKLPAIELRDCLDI